MLGKLNSRVGPTKSLFLLNDLHPHVFLTPVSGGRNVRSWYLGEAELEVTTDLASGIWAHYPRLPAIWLLQSTQACNLELISEYQSAARVWFPCVHRWKEANKCAWPEALQSSFLKSSSPTRQPSRLQACHLQDHQPV